MKISEIIHDKAILPALQARDKAGILQELARGLVLAHPQLAVEQVVQILLERENLGSTGIGSGVAIPHGKYPDLDEIVAGFGRSTNGVDFDSQDGEPTHLFFVLLAPEDSAGIHLKALAKLSRLLKQASFREKLLAAPDAQSLAKIVQEEDEKSS